MDNFQKAVLYLLADLYAKLGIENEEVNTRDLKLALERGQTWVVPRLLSFFLNETSEEIANETLSFLRMWCHIEDKGKSFSAEQRQRVADEVPDWERRATFCGFAGNDESEHLKAAMFWTNQLNRFPSFKGRNLHARFLTLNTIHRPMLAVYRALRADHGMTLDTFIGVISAPGVIERAAARAEGEEVITSNDTAMWWPEVIEV